MTVDEATMSEVTSSFQRCTDGGGRGREGGSWVEEGGIIDREVR